MMDSEKYLYYCLGILETDKEVSHDTKVLMFLEYGKKLLAEQQSVSDPSPWFDFASFVPPATGRYEVYRASVSKQHYELWTGEKWNYNDDTITHWRYILSPIIH